MTSETLSLVSSVSTRRYSQTHRIPWHTHTASSCQPRTDRGVGFTDPVTDRIAAYVANFINCLPALMENIVIGQHVKDTHAWQHGPSQALKDAWKHIRQLAAIVHIETEHAQKTEPATPR